MSVSDFASKVNNYFVFGRRLERDYGDLMRRLNREPGVEADVLYRRLSLNRGNERIARPLLTVLSGAAVVGLLTTGGHPGLALALAIGEINRGFMTAHTSGVRRQAREYLTSGTGEGE